ncbi:MAG TPA: hypothetical protein VKX46_11440 [Ktedonobacteraceae bacterium]|nr:hypothetical protein [Ktedonobacteraceae bacterium]
MARSISSKTAFQLPRRQVSYLRMVAAMRELADLSEQWYQFQRHTEWEEMWVLRKVRRMLVEIEAGYVENLAERFRLETESIPHKSRRRALEEDPYS